MRADAAGSLALPVAEGDRGAQHLAPHHRPAQLLHGWSAHRRGIGGLLADALIEGQMVGFAMFKLLSVEGAPDKVIRGYFVSPVNPGQLVVTPNGGTPGLQTGTNTLKLID